MKCTLALLVLHVEITSGVGQLIVTTMQLRISHTFHRGWGLYLKAVMITNDFNLNLAKLNELCKLLWSSFVGDFFVKTHYDMIWAHAWQAAALTGRQKSLLECCKTQNWLPPCSFRSKKPTYLFHSFPIFHFYAKFLISHLKLTFSDKITELVKSLQGKKK